MINQLETGNFYGQTLRQHDAGGFGLSETQYRLGSTLPPHSHQSPYLGFVLNGRYTETCGRRVRFCDSFTLVYHPAGELHEQYFDSNVTLFRIELRDERISRLRLMERKWEGLDSRKHRALRLTQRVYQEFCQPDEVSHLAIEGLCLELIAAIARQTNPKDEPSRHVPKWLHQAHELIKSSFLEQLTLSSVARAVNVHPVTLAREFRQQYGCTLGGLVRSERIGFASRALMNSQKSLTEVAISAGFYDQSHFAKVFKRQTGLTPAQYRARFRAG